MRLYKRGTVYWFELEFNRKQIRKSTKSRNRVVAGQIASAYHLALIKGDVGITEKKAIPAFKDAMKDFLDWSVQEHHAHPATTKRYRTSSKALLKVFRSVPLDAITAEEVERYKATRAAERSGKTKRKLRPATVNRELACLRAMFNQVLKGDVLLRNPVSRVRFLAEDNQQDRVVKFQEQREYLKAATARLKAVAGLILETGMRPEEVFTLRDANVDLEGGYLKVLKGKTPAARRRIELTDEAARILRDRLNEVGSGYLFPCETDSRRPMPKIQEAHKRALRDSKVPPFRLYDLRHTWATRAAEAGVDLVTLAAMMGHSRIQMVMRYAHPTQNHQASAMERIVAHAATAERKERAAAARLEERLSGTVVVMKERSA